MLDYKVFHPTILKRLCATREEYVINNYIISCFINLIFFHFQLLQHKWSLFSFIFQLVHWLCNCPSHVDIFSSSCSSGLTTIKKSSDEAFLWAERHLDQSAMLLRHLRKGLGYNLVIVEETQEWNESHGPIKSWEDSFAARLPCFRSAQNGIIEKQGRVNLKRFIEAIVSK